MELPAGSQSRSRAQGVADSEIRAIPADHDAERAVLSAIFLDHQAIWQVRDILSQDSFDQPRHQILYRACGELTDKGIAVTLITLRNHLQEQGALEQVGGVAALAEVADAVPTAAHVVHHADVVRRKALARGLIRSCERIASRGYEGEDSVEQLLEDAQRAVLQLAMGHRSREVTTLDSEVDATIEFIRQLNAGQITGLPSGFHDLDDKTGGFDGGDLVILAARPSMGKTALALNMARNCAVDRNGCVAIFSLEMTSRQLVLRLMMGEALLDLGRLRRGLLTEQEMERLLEASRRLENARMFIDDSGTLTVSDIAAKSRRLHQEHQLSLIIVDYIQLVQTNRSSDRREQEVAEISRSLKLLSKDLNVPILAISQLNRSPELRPNKRPLLADLRESGAIEQDADIVLLIYRDEVYDEDTADQGIAELNIAKQRNGPTGLVRLQFESKYARFYDLYREVAAPPEAGFSEPPF